MNWHSANDDAWSEELGDCTFLQVSLQADLLASDFADQGIRVGPSLSSPVLVVGSFALLCFLGFAKGQGSPSALDRAQDSKEQRAGLSLHVLVLLGLTMSLDFFCTDQYQPSMPEISRELEVSYLAMASTIQIHQLGSALAMICAGHWLRRYSLRQVILAGQLFFAASTLGCAFAPSFGWFVASRILQGFSASSSVAVSAMLVTGYSDRYELLRAANLVSGAALLGHIVGPTAGGLLASAAGWRTSFLSAFGLAVLILLANYMLLPSSPLPDDPDALQPETGASQSGTSRPPRSSSTFAQQILVLFGLSLLRGSSYVVVAANAFVLEGYYGLDVWKASILMSVLVAAGAFGMAASATLAFTPTQAMNLFSPLLLLSAGYAAVVASAMIGANPLTYMSGLALHQFLAHAPAWAVLAEAQQESELDDAAGLSPHVYAGLMNVLASVLSLGMLFTIGHGPSAVLYTIAGMAAASQLCIRAGSLWQAAKKLPRPFQDAPEPKPVRED